MVGSSVFDLYQFRCGAQNTLRQNFAPRVRFNLSERRVGAYCFAAEAAHRPAWSGAGQRPFGKVGTP